jgi:hypothetical protein
MDVVDQAHPLCDVIPKTTEVDDIAAGAQCGRTSRSKETDRNFNAPIERTPELAPRGSSVFGRIMWRDQLWAWRAMKLS